MYYCGICDKEFTSNKKLLSYLERCEKRTRGIVCEYRSEKRSTLSRGYESASRPKLTLTSSGRARGSKSDGEHLDTRAIEKLSDERRSLKDQLMEVDSIHMEDTRKDSPINI